MIRKSVARTALGIGLCGAAGLGWGLLENRAFTLRYRSLMLPPQENEENESGRPSSSSLKILHLSDIHLLPNDTSKIDYIRSLAETEPDFLVITGDSLSSVHSLDSLMRALEPFVGIPGAFVYGSNDYYSPIPKNPFAYLLPIEAKNLEREMDLPWEEMSQRFEESGWVNLNNRRATMNVGEWVIDLVGMDDPHINRARMPAVRDDGVAQPHVRIGLVHAPYLWALQALYEDGVELAFAGHTHGGQLALPCIGSLTTNCDLPTAYDSGLFTWPLGTSGAPLRRDGDFNMQQHTMAVQLSAGMGGTPYVPLRVLRRPEATLLAVTRAELG
ncbi:metallophosphoesterase [Actinotignum urinale]|uniref:metallophosphoesterase n=1 Tax=Actinotignum urinale TaxID=190146 RepID=UPI0003B304A7|nr:metallophosphoesterase [Actinotignum urinale]MDY5161106.1 metallophosphoesterase [Actinotignum urinale]